MEQERIILIGAGNVAHHLAAALLKAGENLCQIYSRTLESARLLGMKTGIAYTAEMSEIYPDGDIYIFCVSDDSLRQLELKKKRCYYILPEVCRWIYSSLTQRITVYCIRFRLFRKKGIWILMRFLCVSRGVPRMF